MRPRDPEHAEDWLLERAEEAAAAGLDLERALQAVRDGYSSIDADRRIRAELDADDDADDAGPTTVGKLSWGTPLATTDELLPGPPEARRPD